MNTNERQDGSVTRFPGVSQNRINLVRACAQKPIRQFEQFDVFYMPDGGDDLMTPDENGYCVMGGCTDELKNLEEPRLYLPIDMTREEAIATVRKLLEVVENYWTDAPDRPKGNRLECEYPGHAYQVLQAAAAAEFADVVKEMDRLRRKNEQYDQPF